jgi:hypothetical protein
MGRMTRTRIRTAAARARRAAARPARSPLVALAAAARAQDLARLLPADTALALGLYGLDDATGLLAPLVDPWVELGVGEALADASAGSTRRHARRRPLDPTTPTASSMLPPRARGPRPLGPARPRGVARRVGEPLQPAAGADAARPRRRRDRRPLRRAARARGARGAESLNEGAIGFVVRCRSRTASRSPRRATATCSRSRRTPTCSAACCGCARAARAEASATPRRRRDPRHLGDGELVGFLDLGPLARALAPLAGGLGFDAASRAWSRCSRRSGPVRRASPADRDGTATTTLRRLDPKAATPRCARCSAAPAPAPRELLAWVPDGRAVGQVTARPGAWWAYLATWWSG